MKSAGLVLFLSFILQQCNFLARAVPAGEGLDCEPEPPSEDDVRIFFDIEIDELQVGRIVFRMLQTSPRTSENFRHLARGVTIDGEFYSYKNSTFHRILPGFVAQGGDVIEPGKTTDSISIYGEVFRDENFKCWHTKRGLLSMANVGPHTNGCHFFITFEPTPWLNGRHHVFGEVEQGLAVLTMIENVGTNSGDPTGVVRIVNSGEIIDGEDVTESFEIPQVCPTDICLEDQSFDARQGSGIKHIVHS